MRLTEFQDCYNVSQNFKKKEQSLQKKKEKRLDCDEEEES